MKIRDLLLLPLLFASLAMQASDPPSDLLQQAKKGDVEAMTELGIRYLEGQGIKKNENKGFKYLQSAAKQNDPEALFLVGDCLMNGRGTQPDFRRAVSSFRQAAELGHTEAQHTMAFLYTQGVGVSKNPKEAMRWQLLSEGLSETEIEARLAEVFPAEEVEDGEAEDENCIYPRFRGGTLNDFRTWVRLRIRYPEEAARSGVEGRVVIQFIVGKNGRLEEFKVLSSPHHTLTDAALKVLKISPRWTPGYKNGEPVRVKYTIPIDFRRG